jgi:lysophospholipase L1-like esterase
MVIGVAACVVLALAGNRSAHRNDPTPQELAAATRSADAAAARENPRRVAFLGDSWTLGAGADGNRGYVDMLRVRLPDWALTNFGDGGTGYAANGGEHGETPKRTFDQRIKDVVRAHPSIVVIQGSLNDRAYPTGVIAAAAAKTLGDLRAAVPGARILVIGASYTPGSTHEDIDRINQSISAAAAARHLLFLNPAAENWNDPNDPTIWWNPNHPNNKGHGLIADHLRPLLEKLVGSTS